MHKDTLDVPAQLELLGKNIKFLREARNLPLEALSSKTNISVKILTDMESGADFEARYLVLLSDFYKVSPSSLFLRSFIHDTKSLFQK